MVVDLNTPPDEGVTTFVGFIDNKWKLPIIKSLLGGTKRFGELRRSIPNISQKVLTDNLKEMASDGLITRTVYTEVPPKVEYTLTELGRSLLPIILAMRKWGRDYNKNHKKHTAK
ncbi:MAG: helix-turn-helix transcriptional regulator [Candidatus Nomurabacteria bacterium]|jgi:DNA-binding HxlR family transcriptional regulator|nr:helix-turn-helix transcriptional regulator [Candidatus Nomurabacteria bacterium]